MKERKREIIYKSTDELIPYINNPRDNEEAVDLVASSIKNFGFNVPVVIDKNNEIVTGHTRLKAAKKLNIDKIPCIIAEDLTPSEVKAYRLADNKVAEVSSRDYELLNLELDDLTEFDMSDFGFMDSNDIDLDMEDEFLPINDEGLKKDKSFNNILTFGRKKIVIDDEELSLLFKKFDEYVDEYGVTFGFVRWLINETD